MIVSCKFPTNPVLKAMRIVGGDDFFKNFELDFKDRYTKEYGRVPIEYAYGLLYAKKPATYYTEHIKGKYKSIIVKGKEVNNP